MRLFKKKPSTLIGLDIGSSAIKLLVLSHEDGRYTIEDYIIAPLPEGVVVEKLIKDREALTQVIKTACDQSQFKTDQAAIAVAGSSVITKVIQIDADLSEEDRLAQVTFEVNRDIALRAVNFDYVVLAEVEGNSDLLEVLVVTCRRENVQLCCDVVQKAGLRVKFVDVDSYAVQRTCALLTSELPNRGVDKTVAVVDVGEMVTSVTVLHDMTLVFNHEALFGHRYLTEAIEGHDNRVYAAARLMSTQIQRMLQFFLSATEYERIDHVLLAGGAVLLEGVADEIARKIAIPVTLVNPFAAMFVESHIDTNALYKQAPALLVSCGLAMRSLTT
ncbi:MAG: type IV pilus assembly protein PilM [Gammaproteobacteria bacterium]